jgi:FKBP-type peptidyl-prolyl cis-trans isomerase 2
MPLHSPEAVVNELATIRKDISTPGKGNNCLPDDFAKIHYKAYIADTGRIVEDTYTRNKGKPAPKVFIIGHFDEIKCFDLILPQMKQGESSTIRCPAKLVHGTMEKYP